MSNLSAFFSVKTYKHALNDYRVTFEYTSTVREVDVPSIPMYSFKFTPYADIQQASNNNEYTIDVIGSLLSIGSLNHLSGGTKQNIPFELEDIDGSKVNCLLWGKFAEYILQRIKDIGVGPYIVVIQFATTEIKNGEVQSHNSGQVISKKSSQSSYSMEDDFIRKTVRKNLDELSDTNEPGKYVVLATIKGLVKTSKWWYNGCIKCNGSARQDSKMWYCHVCIAHWPTAKPTYKVEVIVMDDTNSASMIVFGKEAERMLDIPVEVLIQTVQNRGEEPVEYPMELEGLIDRRMLFKLLSRHHEMDAKHDNGSSSLSVNYDNDGCVFSSKDSGTCSNFNDGVVDGDITTNAIVDDDVNAITPMKRSNDFILDSILNDPTVQQSSTKLLKKIKQEKME
ncbi:PREDICTED: uncharacterized protein LOC105954304 [Erythranthe guttata]|uniref:uncharacterized protein LOC105954304 n=1 Tax=Erythranthe guttata TaxID=4155 RepID=UPI00064E0C1B|nr:PREDICTED: uncharacterized protein LOC105954304 [Erythranthe guttata]|eukprot:XP_012833431.1 PREDICTED: uncharacterized protein LOC105954304 [Erythranthe guttata]